MHYNYHLIKNFPKHYPLWRKVLANLIFCIGKTIIHRRKNFLNQQDRAAAEKLLRKGDVVLVGGLRRFSSLIIKGPITHAMIYIGKQSFVHAVCDGVEADSLQAIFREYDTMIILRPKRISPSRLNKAVKFALGRIGIPFDFEFKRDKKKIYCSELILYAFAHANISTVIGKNRSPVHPHLFINRHFSIIFRSHNLSPPSKFHLKP